MSDRHDICTETLNETGRITENVQSEPQVNKHPQGLSLQTREANKELSCLLLFTLFLFVFQQSSYCG